jgi:hypothetical protein
VTVEGETFDGMRWTRVDGVAVEDCFASGAAD